jgi:hypothetical protein
MMKPGDLYVVKTDFEVFNGQGEAMRKNGQYSGVPFRSMRTTTVFHSVKTDMAIMIWAVRDEYCDIWVDSSLCWSFRRAMQKYAARVEYD